MQERRVISILSWGRNVFLIQLLRSFADVEKLILLQPIIPRRVFSYLYLYRMWKMEVFITILGCVIMVLEIR